MKVLKKSSKFVLCYDDVTLLLDFLYRALKDRQFDFTYKLSDMSGEPVVLLNQQLSSELEDPIRAEIRGKRRNRSEVLVIITESDELLISISGWRKPLFVDLGEKDHGKISITNADEDVYIFQIHC